MKQNTWFSSLFAVALFVVCVLGCNKPDTGTTNTTSTPNSNSSSAASPATTPSADIAGAYSVVGTNEDGSPYKGALDVIKRGDVYQFRWNAGKPYDGVGVQNGNVVAVAFTGGADGKGCGVVSYQILSDGTLDGLWGYWGVNERGSEKAERTGGSGIAGDYNLNGKNPNGSAYKGTLSITPKGGGYAFAWSNNSSGFGVKQGNSLSVGIGGSRCAFVAYEIKPDGMLEGVWGGYGSDRTGTEKATKK
jgi:hypothetical protein